MDTNFAIAGIVLLLFCYLLPTFVAGCRGHHNTMAIFVLNLLLGWTFLGWIAAAIWCVTSTRRYVSEDA